MAKETFDRSKPHVNIGTVDFGQIATDTSGQLSYSDDVDPTDDFMLVGFDAPASLKSETAAVAFPIDTEFLYDPATSGPALSLDFEPDVISQNIPGTSHIEVSLAIVQDEPFLATGTSFLDGTEIAWTTLVQRNLVADDFRPVDGGLQRPDFSQPFQFGYAFSGEYSSTALDVDLQLDNRTVEITTVPEPTTMGLAFSLGAAYVWHRWFGTKD